MNERVKELRKALGLTLQKFGDRVGMKRNSLSQVENGTNGVSNQLFSAIVREFNVNEQWLRTGEGEMFAAASTHDQVEHIVQQALKGNDEFRIQVFTALGEMTDEEWDMVKRFVEKLRPDPQPPVERSIYDEVPDTQEELDALRTDLTDGSNVG